MTYADGNEPMVGDLVDCIDFLDLTWLGTHRVSAVINTVNAGPMLKSNRCNWMWLDPAGFRLVRRSEVKEPHAH